ncbi:MAG: hypothetical protein AB7K52_10660 [Phycisphaerales bacterium]
MTNHLQNDQHFDRSATPATLDDAFARRLDSRFADTAGSTPPVPALLLGRVARRRYARRARALGAALGVLTIVAGAWLTIGTPAPSRPASPEIALDPAALAPDTAELREAMARRAQPMGSGVYASIVARAGERPGSSAWQALIEQ